MTHFLSSHYLVPCNSTVPPWSRSHATKHPLHYPVRQCKRSRPTWGKGLAVASSASSLFLKLLRARLQNYYPADIDVSTNPSNSCITQISHSITMSDTKRSRVYFDISIGNSKAGRVTFELVRLVIHVDSRTSLTCHSTMMLSPKPPTTSEVSARARRAMASPGFPSTTRALASTESSYRS